MKPASFCFFLFFEPTARFLSQLGKQEVLNFFNETGLCVCRDILEVLVSEIMMIELKNCPDFRVKDHLGKISHCFYNGMLVFLDNGIGVKRPDGRASKLNVRALVQYAISNFGWSSSIQSDGQTKKNGSKAAPGAAPAVTIFQLFRWSEAAFRIKHGIESESKIIISTFVNSAIQKALGRKHALTINERVTKKQFVCKSLQHFNIESVEEKLHKKQKKSEIIMEEEEIRKKREKSETAEEKKEDFLKDNDEWNEFFAQKEETVPGFDLIEETIAFFGKENNMHDEMSNKLDSV